MNTAVSVVPSGGDVTGNPQDCPRVPLAWRDFDYDSQLFTAACDIDRDIALFPSLAMALRHWLAKRGGRDMPDRSDIDPLDMVGFLPRVMLADIERGPLRFRYRLAGTGICKVHPGDPTGLAADDLQPPAYGALLHQQYTAVLASRRPALHLNLFDNEERYRSYAHLILPLTRGAEEVAMLMTIDSLAQNQAEMMRLLVRLQHRAAAESGAA